MNPVSKTAYYCAGVRMQDANAALPLIGDNYAKLLLGNEGLAYFNEFRHLKAPNAGNVVRHYLIDQYLKAILAKQADTTIILVGAGFDSRAFRLSSGNWVEVDEPSVIDYKNFLLPEASCPNKLQRVAIDFATEKLAEKLAPWAGKENVVIVVEGVLMYLGADAKEGLLKTLTTLFPRHMLYCDLMTKKFFEKLGQPIHKIISNHGSTFTDMRDDPQRLFIDHGYKNVATVSILQKSIELGLLKVPKFFANLFLKRYYLGYTVCTFSYGIE